jgi:hypothetical protein
MPWLPDPGQHRTLFYGVYSNRARGAAHSAEADTVASAERPRDSVARQVGPG